MSPELLKVKKKKEINNSIQWKWVSVERGWGVCLCSSCIVKMASLEEIILIQYRCPKYKWSRALLPWRPGFGRGLLPTCFQAARLKGANKQVTSRLIKTLIAFSVHSAAFHHQATELLLLVRYHFFGAPDTDSVYFQPVCQPVSQSFSEPLHPH